jgi:hypothetical protein
MRRRLVLLTDNLSTTGGLFRTHLGEDGRRIANENGSDHNVSGASQKLSPHEKTSLLLGSAFTLDTGGHCTKKNALPAQSLDQKDAIVLS